MPFAAALCSQEFSRVSRLRLRLLERSFFFPDLLHLEHSDSQMFILKAYSDSKPFAQIDKS